MRVLVAISFVIAVALSAPVLDDELNGHWELYKNTHGKTYQSQQEETLRYVCIVVNNSFSASCKSNRAC